MKRRAASLLVFVTLLCATGARAGEIYKYVEADGTIVYTNVPPGKSTKATKLKGSFAPAPRPTDAPAPVPPPRAKKTRVSREEYDQYISNAARRYRIPEALVWAVMHAESAFNPHAVSRVGASGLMQLMPATAEEMYVTDIFDVKQNIEGGTRYLRVLANMFDGDMVKMVAAYNAGPDAVKKYGGKVPPYAETQAYVQKVVKLYFQYKQRQQAKGETDADDAETSESFTPPQN